MIIKKIIAITVLTFVISGQSHIAYARCVLPVPDGEIVKPSPASAQGVIAKVHRGQITLKGKKSKPIRFGKKTQLFTVYGGAVNAGEIKVGQHVFIWYVGCIDKSDGSPMAAVIQFCSTDEEPCLK